MKKEKPLEHNVACLSSLYPRYDSKDMTASESPPRPNNLPPAPNKPTNRQKLRLQPSFPATCCNSCYEAFTDWMFLEKSPASPHSEQLDCAVPNPPSADDPLGQQTLLSHSSLPRW